MKSWLPWLVSFCGHFIVVFSMPAVSSAKPPRKPNPMFVELIETAQPVVTQKAVTTPEPEVPDPEAAQPVEQTRTPTKNESTTDETPSSEMPSSLPAANTPSAPIASGLKLSNAAEPITRTSARYAAPAHVSSARKVLGTNCDGETRKPQPLLKTAIPYPPQARARNAEGRLVLQVEVGEEGQVLGVTVLQSVDPDVDAAAQAALRLWKFSPALRCGKPASGTYTIARNFALSG